MVRNLLIRNNVKIRPEFVSYNETLRAKSEFPIQCFFYAVTHCITFSQCQQVSEHAVFKWTGQKVCAFAYKVPNSEESVLSMKFF